MAINRGTLKPENAHYFAFLCSDLGYKITDIFCFFFHAYICFSTNLFLYKIRAIRTP